MADFNIDQIDRLLPSYLSKDEKGRLASALSQFKVKLKSKNTTHGVKGEVLTDLEINQHPEIKYDEIWSPKSYTSFYLSKNKTKENKSPLQGDLFQSIRIPIFNKETNQYTKYYSKAMCISNTCDMDIDNERKIPKELQFAPIVEYDKYIKNLENNGLDNIDNICQNIQDHVYSNLLFLPELKNPLDQSFEGKSYVVLLDQIFHFPAEEYLRACLKILFYHSVNRLSKIWI